MNTLIRAYLRNGILKPLPHRTFASKSRLKPTAYPESPDKCTEATSSKEPPASEPPNEDRKERPSPEPQPWRSNWKIAFFTSSGLLLGTHYFACNYYSINASYGASMLPTMYLSGESHIISKRYRHGHGIRVGDVICAWSPIQDASVIKRVIGMPGDFVWVEGRMVRVPVGCCWLAGDNQAFSRDSRTYGPLPLGLVIGKVVYRVWPPNRWGRTENTLTEIDEREVVPV